ncbi:hypothetical protein FF011L_47540 [Roseimaritima multifibrata]|uniref:Uncharacterized protein n=1 Tax=Roseimaritima multifibrata TaxID=1930274 RepID=A0A517MM35_9BACT|nr:hypothetical protein [Roseimaritima multifibrata]QDS95952.1 hypothetical protein FF011L_47540 [Roseimaritima multifibrata]
MITRLLLACVLCVFADYAAAQFRIQFGRGGNSTQPPKIDHHDQVIRDGHGHTAGVDHHNGSHNRVSPNSRPRPRPSGTHIDHHDHVIRDNHGHVIGREHHDVVHSNRSYHVPAHHGNHHGQYYVEDSRYYYVPPTSIGHTAARPAALAFGGYHQYEDLSGRLETMLNELLLDLHYNYSHNPGFQETYREGYELLNVAKYIHDAEHANDRDAMRAKLGGMDQLFHHIEDDVRGWSRHHHRQIGSLGILDKMEHIEATLHHLMHDVGVSAQEEAPLPGGGIEQAPPPTP